MKHTVAVIDAGGRGSALVAAYAKSPLVEKILAIPGNDLMQMNSTKPVTLFPQVKTTDVEQIIAISRKEQVTFVDVAQDNAVSVGLVDALRKERIAVIGPTKAAGRIEWDKAWARSFGEKYGLPQPTYHVCHSEEEGIAFIQQQPEQAWFVKAAGLAEGKGVLPAVTNKEAIEQIKHMKQFGTAGKIFLLEQWLQGEEFSAFILADGKQYIYIGSAQDNKRVNDYDEGLNTGGMGCVTPPLVVTKDIQNSLSKEIFNKVIEGMQQEGTPYTGILYLGGMLVKEGQAYKPYVIEFNARWGDPEAEVIVPGITSDFLELNLAAVQGTLASYPFNTDGKTRIALAGTSRGYPQDYTTVKGKHIHGLEEARKITGIQIYGAGVKNTDDAYVAAGGRLFYIVGEGESIIAARKKAYEAIAGISIEGNNLHYRTDIGWRDVERLRK